MSSILAKILDGGITLKDLEELCQTDSKEVNCLRDTQLQQNHIIGVSNSVSVRLVLFSRTT